MRCSFCHKSEDTAKKLISSPSHYPPAYICDECVLVCASIIEEDGATMGHPILIEELQLLQAVRHWIRQESLGADAAEALAQVRAIAIRLTQE